jgi:ABC-type glycerol-3-phosphate transport system substrate-binding protein
MTIDATVNGAFCEDPAESRVVGITGYAPVPSGSDNQKGGQHSLAVHNLFISKFSRNPEAAFLFSSWALSKDIQLKAMELVPHSGVSSLGAMQGPAFTEKYGAFKDGMLEAISKANVDYLPTIPQASEIIDRVGRAISEVLAGTRSAKDALETVNREINENVLR